MAHNRWTDPTWISPRGRRIVELVLSAALVGLLVRDVRNIQTSRRPPLDWSATLRTMQGKITMEGATALDCVKHNVAGPHTLPTQTEWDAVKACAQRGF
jgi:hypothetical protein